MLTQHEDWIQVSPGRLLAKAPTAGGVYVGHGLRGYVRACVDGFAAGCDVAFVRSKVKQHGLKEAREGARTSAADGTARIGESIYPDEPIAVPLHAHRSIERHALACEDATFSSDFAYATPAALELARTRLRSGIRLHVGEFLLSSGAVATQYIDTIPAITSFQCLAAISGLIQPLLRRPAYIVAPPYGAVSLGIFLGMNWQTPVVIPLRNDVRASSLVETLNRLGESGSSDHRGSPANVLIVDDYYSTGSTVERVLAGLSAPNEVFAICRKPDSKPVLGRLVSLFVNHGGEIRWSDELQRATDAMSDAAVPAV